MGLKIELPVDAVYLICVSAPTLVVFLWARRRIERRARNFIAELDLLSDTDRDAVWRSALNAPDPEGLGAFLALLGVWAIVFGLPLVRLLENALNARTDGTKLLLNLLALSFVWVGGLWAQLAISRRSIQRSIRQELARRSIPVCPTCGYCLRGIEASRCPECGTTCRPDMCWVCLGRGHLSTSWYLIAATATTAVWALSSLWVLRQGGWRAATLSKTHWGLLVCLLPLLLLGLWYLVSYVRRGARTKCPACGGSGRASGQDTSPSSVEPPA